MNLTKAQRRFTLETDGLTALAASLALRLALKHPSFQIADNPMTPLVRALVEQLRGKLQDLGVVNALDLDLMSDGFKTQAELDFHALRMLREVLAEEEGD